MTSPDPVPSGTHQPLFPETSIRVEPGKLWTTAVRCLSLFPLHFEEERKRLIYGCVSLIVIPMLGAFGVYHLIFGPRMEGIANLGVATYWVLSLWLLRNRTDGSQLYRMAAILSGLLFIYFGTLGGIDQHRALWALAYPMFAFLLVGLVEGIVYSLILFSSWLAFFFLPSSLTGAGDYSSGFIVRFVTVYLTLFIASLFAERVRQMYLRAMTVHQGRLEDDKSRLVTAELQMRQIALNDELTNIPNRRAILETLEDSLRVSEESDHVLSVAILDLDNFKKINDQHGHLGGDEVLRRCAERIVAAAKNGNLAGRYGGEEFLIVLPGTAAHTAKQSMEDLRASLEANPVRYGDGTILVSASIGIAETRTGNLRPERLLSKADAALYEAKTRGRNRVVVFSDMQARV